MPIIQVDDNWRINSDEHCWMVERYRGMSLNKRTGEREPSWRPVTYHQSLGQAAAKLAARKLRVSEVKGFAETIAEWEKIQNEIENAFTMVRS